MIPTKSERVVAFDGLLVGLMLGIVQAHAVQPLAAWLGPLTWQPKYYVSIAGAVLYTVCLVLVAARNRVGYWIAIVGPLVGLVAVALSVAFVPGAQSDVFQWSAGAMLQLPAIVIAVHQLREAK